MTFPSISIVTCTLNTNIKLFKDVLDSIEKQKYPKKLLTQIVVDGGSTNGTLELAKKYGCEIYSMPQLRNKDEVRASIAIQKAKNDLILVLESDNILTSSDWLEKMVKPFLENSSIFCTYSAYNSYKRTMAATTRYAALFGSPEPTLYYLDKSEKIPLTQKKYNKGIMLSENSDYYVINFTKDTLPTLGDNGHMFLRSAIEKVNIDPEEYVHLDAFSSLLDLGYNTFGVVKNSIIHVSNPSLLNVVRRRVAVKESYYDGRRGKRKYLVFDWNSKKDVKNLIKYIFFSLTIVVPLVESIKGYTKIKDWAWFLHPLLCILMITSYSSSEIKWILKRRK